MENVSFFSVVKNNFTCAVCKESRCTVRYMPERKRVTPLGTATFVEECVKDVKKYNAKKFKV